MQYEKSGTFAFLGGRDELCIRNLNTQLHDRMTTAMKKCYYSQAPLPFVGQKRMFASEFRKVLKRFSDRTVFVDLFGGSGLLSHITKRERPDATVIYNDHDNYRERLENISRTNALLSDLRRLSEGIPRHRMLSREMHGIFLERIPPGGKHRLRGLSHHLVLPAVLRQICQEHRGARKTELLQQYAPERLQLRGLS